MRRAEFKALANRQKWREVLRLLDELVADGITLDCRIYNDALRSIAKSGR